jgi:hypothetical protein
MSVNLEALPPHHGRRRARGLLSRLFFFGGHAETTRPNDAYAPMVMRAPHDEVEAAHVEEAEPPSPAPPPKAEPETPARPSYTRPLPSVPELASDISSLRSFALPAPTAEADDCLLQLLRQLCHQFLGGLPRDRQLPSHYNTEIDALYQGAPPRMDLQDALKRLLLATPAPPPPADDRTRTSLELFYRHLMILIKALMIHLYMYRLIPDDKNVGTMHNWYATLGHLETLRITLVHGSETGQVDLHDAPRYWEELIERTVDEIQKCLRTLHSAEEQSLAYKTALAIRDKESDELRRRFDPSALMLERMQGERAAALESLRNVTSVASILHNEAATHTNSVFANNNNITNVNTTTTMSRP